MIYAAKPQRGGRNIHANTNNLPQDPPPVPESTVIPTTVSWFRRLLTKIRNVFGRRKQ